MAYERMDIDSIFVGGGPVASLVVLRTRDTRGKKPRRLPIKIGGIEAAAISKGIEGEKSSRPLTHDLMLSVMSKLGGTLKGVRISDVSGQTFFAQLELEHADGERVFVDARPSDALALAVRTGAPVYAADSVLDSADFPDFKSAEAEASEHKLKEFHEFVENLSPDDFKVEKSS